jgi:hypothetical protein
MPKPFLMNMRRERSNPASKSHKTLNKERFKHEEGETGETDRHLNTEKDEECQTTNQIKPESG